MLRSITIALFTVTGAAIAAPLHNSAEQVDTGPTISDNPIRPWMRQKGLLTDEQEALYLTGADTNQYTSAIAWAPLVAWNWVTKGTLNVGNVPAYSGDMIIDHRSTLIIGSHKTVKNWWANVPGSEPCGKKMCETFGFYTFPCSTPPTVTFTFGGHQFPISPEDFSLGPTDDGGTKCFGAIIGSENVPEDAWVIGEKFMKSTYTVFDRSNSRVGFAVPV
ncbi:unnamed protein product [Rhizoctonia solani]|nr:unnamed protein product [Rhizoctonia solani]